MAATNIDRFNRVAGSIFAKLYASFPVEIDLDAMHFLPDLRDDDDPDEFATAFDSPEFFRATVEWLIATGFITSKTSTMDAAHFYMCCLTAKGLEALKSIPKSVGGESLGGQLAEAVKEGTTSQLKELGSQVISKGFGFLSSAAITWASGQ